MKRIMMVVLIIVSFAFDVKGDTLLSLKDINQLPIGQGDQVAKEWIIQSDQVLKDWSLTNKLWVTAVMEQFIYQDSIDPSQWWQNPPNAYSMSFQNYDSFENYLATNGMKSIDFIKKSANGKESDVFVNIIIDIEFNNGASYWPLATKVNLGKLESVTTNSFYGLPLADEYVVIPIANLKSFELRTGTPPSPTKFWYTWNSITRVSKLNFGTSSDYCVTADGLCLSFKKKYTDPSERRRITIVAEDPVTGETLTKVFTQHGALMTKASSTRVGNTLQIRTPKGSDVVIQGSSDNITWTNVGTKSWSENVTGIWEFQIDPGCTMCIFKVGIN